ncbi:MAG: ABC transporter ATP-binding protein [Roseiflexus sp.]|uniref:ABC transporter ATP-binding protein n=1 Tax=Roseiflexus sp. TaxID=2562120 RepID=UPI0025D13B00|nr:ABC transporter ATP-binding protein [Roseiflexus sp.]MCL6540413.1 ABC transporter ATP-binding protein [Roseiflexus sp.]
MTDPRPLLLEVEDLKTYFYLDEGVVRAVDGVSFTIRRGQTVGVVGESGCGKSITARSILQIVRPPGRIVSGSIRFHRVPATQNNPGEVIEIMRLDPMGKPMRMIRGGEISMVFQEPMTSLSPVHTVGSQVIEAIMLHQPVSKEEARRLAIHMFTKVGMQQPERTIDRYPHQLSGGMRQRAMIAMALSCNPSLLIADEPTTALDVTTEAQILQLMRDLQRELGMAIIFITHNLGVVAQMTEVVMVMYMGRVVEQATVDDLFYAPRHPYTRLLLRSIPKLGSKAMGIATRLESIKGTVPHPYAIPQGCPFHPRCGDMIPGVCDAIDPPVVAVSDQQMVRCHLYASTPAHGVIPLTVGHAPQDRC